MKSLLLAALIVLVPTLHADVRAVAPTGAPYSQIQAAVDAANDGDVVLVKSGTYASFEIHDRSIAVVADVNTTVNVDGAIRVTGLAATRTVVIAGFVATGTLSSNRATRHGLLARNCAGSLRVLGCELTGVPLNTGIAFVLDHYPSPLPACYEGQGAFVESCSDLVFAGCSLNGSNAPSTSGYGGGPQRPWAGIADGGHGLYATGSQIALFDTTAKGGMSGLGSGWKGGGPGCEPAPYADPLGYLGAAGEGCRASSSFVFASATTFRGAVGWSMTCLDQCFCEHPSRGGNALVVDAPTGPAYELACANVAGSGGFGTGAFGPPCPCGIGGNFCATFVPNAASGSATVGPVSALSGNARGLALPRVARENAPFTATFTGQPGDAVVVRMTERTGFVFDPNARGVRLVRRTRAPEVMLQAGTIGPSGTLSATWSSPDLGAGVEAQVLHVQALFTDPSGQKTLSSPAAIVLLDAAF